MHLLYIFFLFGFLCFPIFLCIGAFCFHLCLSVFLLKHTCLHHELVSDKENRKISPLKMTAEGCLSINCVIFLKFVAMLKKTCCLKKCFLISICN
jgi:hypothetical protein